MTNARRSINPNKPLPPCSTPSQGDVQVTATVAAELDYTTPAFKTALQQSVANAAGVPPEAVTIFEIKPSPSGSDLEILYSVDGLSPTDTVSDFKARIDKAVASGWFTSSLQGDGYFGVSAKAPTAVIRLAFTMKQVNLRTRLSHHLMLHFILLCFILPYCTIHYFKLLLDFYDNIVIY